ncbi:origin recognition complex subunit 4 [Marchantia polymorpha subsp. ruderalis]|uniref:Origin of replication complex subunit 4 n=1 Tax=Marchantia polymorpha TaxID=3197 RepID=A0A2R6X7M1_MARPO|nr:hypothetical protein MARPO_0031s0066 [Marchantia polymorpha]BBN01040.1 hypothetical protein Mp_2g04100 [Marchantia polymorpha subsp. ruderalis]|eukprot:PTQ42089.1 hypothetical protein MARPO_0031s0066 [Marchantia polymorpha]
MVGTTIFTERISVTREQVNEAVALLRRKLCGGSNQPLHQLSLLPDAESNRKQLHDLLSHTIVNAYNNSALLLGPRGCGKTLVLERVLADLQSAYPERFSIVRLSGLLHADEYCALKEIARQLCVENELFFSKAASFSENLQFLTAMLKECALSDKALVFALEEFDLFAQRPKQCLLYNLLDAMQSTTSQIAVVGISARLDADQLLEKRVRSRFSHRKFLFLPPSVEDATRLLQDVLTLPSDSQYAKAFNMHTKKLFEKESLKCLISKFTEVDLSPQSVLDLGFRALCNINRDTGLLTEDNFKKASLILRPKPKLETLKGLSVLELYLLVVMNRLEGQNREVYNFNTIFHEYERLCGLHNTCDKYSRQVSQRAFEHLLDRELINYAERFTTVEYTPVKLLISSQELKDGLHSNSVCPTILHQWFSHDNFK